MVMSQFRRSVAADTKKKGGGRGGNFYERYRLPANLAGGTPFALIRADYTDPNPAPEEVEIDPATGRAKEVKKPYYRSRKHKRMVPGKPYPMDELCSAGVDPHNPQPCVGCAAMDLGDKSVTVADVFAMGLVHLAVYHGHPLVDQKTGGMVMKREKANEFVMVYDECGGRTCNFCRVRQGQPPILEPGEGWPNYDPRSITDIFGRRRYFELGKGHLSDIEGFDQSITSTCGNCRSLLITDGFSCPYCNSMVIDMTSDPRTDQQIAEVVLRPYPCMQCQRPVLLREIVACESCEAQNRPPNQLSVFDVVLFGTRQGEGTKSHIVQARPFQSIEEFENTLHPNIRQMLGGKNLRQFITELSGPYEFDKMMAPRSLQDQSKRLELPLPGGQQKGYGQPQQGYTQYGQQPQPGYPQAQPHPAFQQPQPQMQPPPGQFPYGTTAPPQQPPQQWVQPSWQPGPGQPQQPAPGPAPFVPPGRPNYGNNQ